MAIPPIYYGRQGQQYTRGAQLGQGGAGRVYEAASGSRGNLALKLLDPNADTEKRRRFKNELRFCQTHSHANLVAIVDEGVFIDQQKECLFYVMQRYEKSLRGCMKEGLGVFTAMKLFTDVLAGVAWAHKNNVVHRDLKPENILIAVQPFRAVVADFGIAHFAPELQATTMETQEGTRLANHGYAAPEQRVKGQSVGTPADIFALGLILTEMITGEVPYGSGYRRIGDTQKGLQFLDQLVDSMIRQDPSKRPGIELVIDTVEKGLNQHTFPKTAIVSTPAQMGTVAAPAPEDRLLASSAELAWQDTSANLAFSEIRKKGHKYYRRIDMWSLTGMHLDNNRLSSAIRQSAIRVNGDWWPMGVRVGGFPLAKGYRWVGHRENQTAVEFVEAGNDGRILIVDTAPIHANDEIPYDRVITQTFSALRFWYTVYAHLLGSGNEIALSISWGGLNGKVLTTSDAIDSPWNLQIVRDQNKRAYTDQEVRTGIVTSTIANAPRYVIPHGKELASFFFGMFDFPVKPEIYPLLHEQWEKTIA